MVFDETVQQPGTMLSVAPHSSLRLSYPPHVLRGNHGVTSYISDCGSAYAVLWIDPRPLHSTADGGRSKHADPGSLSCARVLLKAAEVPTAGPANSGSVGITDGSRPCSVQFQATLSSCLSFLLFFSGKIRCSHEVFHLK